jgi:hypothetical protein
MPEDYATTSSRFQTIMDRWMKRYKADALTCRAKAATERMLSVAYRRAARYPWLGPPRVKPENE